MALSKVEIWLICSIGIVYNMFDGFHGAFLIEPVSVTPL